MTFNINNQIHHRNTIDYNLSIPSAKSKTHIYQLSFNITFIVTLLHV